MCGESTARWYGRCANGVGYCSAYARCPCQKYVTRSPTCGRYVLYASGVLRASHAAQHGTGTRLMSNARPPSARISSRCCRISVGGFRHSSVWIGTARCRVLYRRVGDGDCVVLPAPSLSLLLLLLLLLLLVLSASVPRRLYLVPRVLARRVRRRRPS